MHLEAYGNKKCRKKVRETTRRVMDLYVRNLKHKQFIVLQDFFIGYYYFMGKILCERMRKD